MRPCGSLAIVVGLFVAGEGLALAQRSGQAGAQARTPARARAAAKNPLAGNPLAVRNGAAKFRTRCAGCHGMDARGYVAPDLTSLWSSGRTDDRIFQIVRRGVPGTDMPPSDPQRVPDKEIWETLAYLRTLGAAAPPPAKTGNAENGERIFNANCARCHMVSGSGGQLGPDLTRIGSGRPRSVLLNKIRGTTETVRPGYEAVTLVTRSGQRIRGVKKNEDEVSIQIMEMSERIQGYMKAGLAEVVNEPKSLMPVYGPDRLNDSDLEDLVRYLGTLRGTAATVAQRR